jgi:hypothetical protein
MTIQSLSRRLRLFLLSLSLFCFGAAAVAWADGAVLPQKISSPPDIEVVSHKWTMYVFHLGSPMVPRSAASYPTERSGKPPAAGPWCPIRASLKPIERQSYTYAAEM